MVYLVKVVIVIVLLVVLLIMVLVNNNSNTIVNVIYDRDHYQPQQERQSTMASMTKLIMNTTRTTNNE